MKAYTGPLAKEAEDIAESLWHKPEGKACGNCDKKFNARNAAVSIVGITKFFEDGRSHRVTRFLCKNCHSNIRAGGPSPALQAVAELEIAAELLRPGPL